MTSFKLFGKKNEKPAILAIDDEPPTLALTHEILDPLGYETLMATTGMEGLELANSKFPKLILLDIRMPMLGGQQVLTMLKQNPKTKDIPVIMITGEQRGKDVEESFARGAVGYIIKPIRIEELREKVWKHVPIEKG